MPSNTNEEIVHQLKKDLIYTQVLFDPARRRGPNGLLTYLKSIGCNEKAMTLIQRYEDYFYSASYRRCRETILFSIALETGELDDWSAFTDAFAHGSKFVGS